MKHDDAKLIQRVLDGDDTAFSALVKKHQKPVHARHLSKSVSEPFDAQGTAEVCRLALCDSGELLQDVDA